MIFKFQGQQYNANKTQATAYETSKSTILPLVSLKLEQTSRPSKKLTSSPRVLALYPAIEFRTYSYHYIVWFVQVYTDEEYSHHINMTHRLKQSYLRTSAVLFSCLQ